MEIGLWIAKRGGIREAVVAGMFLMLVGLGVGCLVGDVAFDLLIEIAENIVSQHSLWPRAQVFSCLRIARRLGI